MSSKNLNECSGCLIISNDENISLPPIGKTNTYDIDLDKPCFFVNNHYISPVQRCYNVKLSNPVSLEYRDKIRINIKIPKNIFGEKYGYSLEDVVKELSGSDEFCAGLSLKSSDGCHHLTRVSSQAEQLDIKDYCGWINVTIYYQVGADDNKQEICNLCEIGYSLCFSPIKLKTLYGACHGGADEVVEFRSETCLEIENVEARRFANNNGQIIEGPENYLCLKIEDAGAGNPTTASFDKFTKTLNVSFDFVAGITAVAMQAVLDTITSATFTATNNVGAGLATASTVQTNYTPIP